MESHRKQENVSGKAGADDVDGESPGSKNPETIQPETLPQGPVGPREGQSYHAAIAEATTRIGKTLAGLYSSKADEYHEYKKSSFSGGDVLGLEKQKLVQKHKSSMRRTDEPESPRKIERGDESDDEENWNLDEAKLVVKELLNSLQTEKRMREMELLKEWFDEKAKVVPGDDADLEGQLEDCEKGEGILTNALEEIDSDVSEKVETKDKGLRKFEQVLNTMVRQGRRTTQEWKNKQRQLERDKAELIIDNDHLLELEERIKDVGEKLLLKESDANNDDQAQKNADLEEKEILAVINAQEKELKVLNARWDVNERRVKMLRVAFNYVSNGAVGPAPDFMVVDTMEEMKTQIRQTKIAEMLKAADLENAHLMEPPDDSEVQQLEQECLDLQEQLMDIDTQVHLLQSMEDRQRELQTRLDTISGGQGGAIPRALPDVEPENALELKEELLKELALVQDKNVKLQPKLSTYETSLANAENSLTVLEEERKKFIDVVTTAKNNLAAEFDVDENLDEEDEVRKQMESRRKEVLAVLDEEEKAFLEGADAQELGVTAALQCLQDEQRRVRELGWEFEQLREEASAYELPQVTRTMINEASTRGSHTMMEMKAESLTTASVGVSSRVDMFRQKLAEEKRAAAAAKAAEDAANIPEEGETADNESAKKDSEADDSTKKSSEADEDEDKEGKDEDKAKKADMESFLRLHSENLELVKELEEIDAQLKAIKDERGHPLDFSRPGVLSGGPDSEENIKEIQKMQQEIFDARRKWWNQRQEPSRIPASVSRRKRASSKESSRHGSKARGSKEHNEDEDGEDRKERRSKDRISRRSISKDLEDEVDH